MANKLGAKHVILIAVGIVLLTFALYEPAYAWLEAQFKPVAVVYVDTNNPILDRVVFAWDGTTNLVRLSASSSAPAPLPDSKSGTLYILCFDQEGGTGIASVTATVTTGTPTSLTFTRTTDLAIPYSPPPGVDCSWWKASYTTPALNTNVAVTPVITDKAGNKNPTQVFYGSTAVPQGDFYINDQKVTIESTLYLNTRTLNIKFTATSGGSVITDVYFMVYDASGALIHSEFLTETQTDTQWGPSAYTLPADGKYTVTGYFKTVVSAYQRMSIGIDTGAAPVPPQTYYRLFLGLLGIIFIAYPVYDVYAEKKPKLKL
jgi:hypothetical protein